MPIGIGQQVKKAMITPPKRFQMQGVRFHERKDGRSINGDSMGLGKTYQATAWIAIHPEIRPVLIICPATLKYQWQEELKKHADLTSEVLSGRKSYPPMENIIIINYDIISYWKDFFMKNIPALIVMDECHYCKSSKALRTKACRSISRKTKHILPMSGTPIINRPAELFPILNMINPKQFNSFWEFAFQYCDPKTGYGGHWDFSGASNLEELHEIVSEIMIRRTKSEVMEELPPKQRTTVPVDISNRKTYNKARNDFISWVEENMSTQKAMRALKAVALVRLGTLKRIAAEGKIKAIKEWIQNWMEDTGEKLVVFAIHKSVVGKLKEAFPEAKIIDGSTAMKKRKASVDKFQNNDNCRLIIGNIQAMGVGLTLTASSTVLFAEIGWTPGEHNQAEDRVLRIGQEADSVNIYYIVGKDTIEEDILEVIEKKRDICSQVLDGKPANMNSLFSKIMKMKGK